MMVMQQRCGGMTQIGRQLPRPKILLNLAVSGKSRWPFGWDILRELASVATTSRPRSEP